MFRLFVFAVLLILAVAEYKKPMKAFLFPVVFGLLTLMLALRCGQGTDYFPYCQIYTSPDSTGQDYEIGYTFLNDVAKFLGIPYTVFIFLYALLVMGLFYLIVTKACTNRYMGLFVAYALYWLQFFESSLLQVLDIMLVLLGFWLTSSKNRIGYLLLGTALACTIHTSAVISILLLLPYWFEKWDKGKAFVKRHIGLTVLATGGLCAALIFLTSSSLPWKLVSFLPEALNLKITSYLEETSYSILSLLSRLAFLAVIVALYLGSRSKLCRAEKICFNAYVLGFIIYCGFFRFDLIASRMNVYYKALEMILIPNLLTHFSLEELRLPVFLRKFQNNPPRSETAARVCIFACTAALLSFMYLKTTKDVMNQSLYYNPGYLYPYYNVFNVEKLYSQRSSPNYAHKEYYAFLGKANPRLIGNYDDLSDSYFSKITVPKDWAQFKNSGKVTDISGMDPLTKEGSLVTLLRQEYSGTIYEYGQDIPEPSPTPEKEIPMRLRDLFQD